MTILWALYNHATTQNPTLRYAIIVFMNRVSEWKCNIIYNISTFHNLNPNKLIKGLI